MFSKWLNALWWWWHPPWTDLLCKQTDGGQRRHCLLETLHDYRSDSYRSVVTDVVYSSLLGHRKDSGGLQAGGNCSMSQREVEKPGEDPCQLVNNSNWDTVGAISSSEVQYLVSSWPHVHGGRAGVSWVTVGGRVWACRVRVAYPAKKVLSSSVSLKLLSEVGGDLVFEVWIYPDGGRCQWGSPLSSSCRPPQPVWFPFLRLDLAMLHRQLSLSHKAELRVLIRAWNLLVIQSFQLGKTPDGFGHCHLLCTALNVEMDRSPGPTEIDQAVRSKQSRSWRNASSGHVLMTRVLGGVWFLRKM